MIICPLCSRNIEGKKSDHHLVPVLKGGRHLQKVTLHQICHDKIHSIFTERELSVSYNSIEKLLAHPEIKKFVQWLLKKPDDFYDSSKRIAFKPGWR